MLRWFAEEMEDPGHFREGKHYRAPGASSCRGRGRAEEMLLLWEGRKAGGWVVQSRLSCPQVGPSFPVAPVTAGTCVRCSRVSCRTAASPWHRCVICSRQERRRLCAAEQGHATSEGLPGRSRSSVSRPLGSCEGREKSRARMLASRPAWHPAGTQARAGRYPLKQSSSRHLRARVSRVQEETEPHPTWMLPTRSRVCEAVSLLGSFSFCPASPRSREVKLPGS